MFIGKICMYLIKIIVLSIFLLFSKVNGITVSNVLDKYRNSLGGHDTALIKTEYVSHMVDGLSNTTAQEQGSLEIRKNKDGKYELITSTSTKFEPRSDIFQNKTNELKNMIWDGKNWYEYNAAQKSVSISKNQEWKNQYVSMACMDSRLDGFLGGDSEPILSLLHQSEKLNIIQPTEKENKSACYILEATSKNGHYKIWFDAEHGFNIARAEVHKQGNDLLYGRSINVPIKPLPNNNPSKPNQKGQLTDYVFLLSDVNFEKIDNKWTPVSASYEETLKYDNGRTQSLKVFCKRKYINYNPDFVVIKAFVPNIPNGTKVKLMDPSSEEMNISFQWQNGKVAPFVDVEVVDEMNRIATELKAENNSVSIKANQTPKVQELLKKTSSQLPVVARTSSVQWVWYVMGAFVVLVLLWLVSRRKLGKTK